MVNVGRDVTLEGWSGIFITHDSKKSYGVVVNLDGKINSVNDINGEVGIGVYVNGNIKDQINAPIINILDNAYIKSTGNGIYNAGYATLNIKGAYIEGVEAGVAIKSGILNINNSTIVATGLDTTPTTGSNNGIKASGATIQMESNNGYAGNMKINIKSGNFTSNNGYVLYEYIGKGTESFVESINISGGEFISKANKDVIQVSDSFKSKNNSFISGGKYSSNITNYLESGYTATLEDDLYIVSKSTLKTVNSSNIINSSNNFTKTILLLFSFMVIVILIYINRVKIVKLLKR